MLQLHKIRIKLYPNYLQGVDGAYIARTDNESSLSIEQVCAALKERGGFTGNYDTLIEYVRQFLREAAYQVCDGYAVNLEYLSIHPNVGGTFNSAADIHDHEKHPISFRFRALSKLRKLAQNIEVIVEGLASADEFIDEFTDVETGAVNETLTTGGMFAIHGHKIKVAGDAAGIGVYFVSSANPSLTVAVNSKLAENTPSKVIGIVPVLPDGVQSWKVAVKTQFTASNYFLKDPRTIESGFTLTRPQG
jgi:hypothetical protein